MAEYIKREDAYNYLREKWKAAESREAIFEADTVRQDAIEISNLPTVDAVEVVRCKDCKYWYGSTCRDGCDRCLCHIGVTMEDDYCSYGKRKDE